MLLTPHRQTLYVQIALALFMAALLMIAIDLRSEVEAVRRMKRLLVYVKAEGDQPPTAYEKGPASETEAGPVMTTQEPEGFTFTPSETFLGREGSV